MQTSEIIEIGELVPDFENEGVLVLFGETAPAELKDMSVIHRPKNNTQEGIQKGGSLTISGTQYKIQEVGSLANKNFDELGHISIYFGDNESQEVLPGAILVTPNIFPNMKIGDTITFE